MTKLSMPLLALSALTLSACDLDIFSFFDDDRFEHQLQEGNWSFDLDRIEFSGNCEDMEESPEPFRMLGNIEYAGGNRLEVELEGLLLIGTQDGNYVFAEASEKYDMPVEGIAVCEDDDEADAGETRCGDMEDIESIPSGMYVSLDGQINGPRAFDGELFVESHELDQVCIIQARYRAQYDNNQSVTSVAGSPPQDSDVTEPAK
jgi:hypothetical protein